MFSKKAKAPKPTREEKKDRRIPLSKYSKGGRVSTMIALVNIAIMALCVSFAVMENGKAGAFIGIIVILVLISALVGFIIGISSFTEENKFYRFSYIGTALNGLVWVGIFLMYIAFL